MLDLDELARLEVAATDAEWFPVYDNEDEDFQRPIGIAFAPEFDTDHGYILTLPGNGHSGFEPRDDDTEADDLKFVCALRNAAPALLATARNYEALLAAVSAVVSCTSTDAENVALEALAKVWEAQAGRRAASGQGYAKPRRWSPPTQGEPFQLIEGGATFTSIGGGYYLIDPPQKEASNE